MHTVRYNPHKDTLFLAGDILAKSTEAGSLAILDFFAHQRLECKKRHLNEFPADAASESHVTASHCKPFYAVRGNHDQMVVQWRAWRDWFEPLQLAVPSARECPRRHAAPSTASFIRLTSASAGARHDDAGQPVGTGSQFLALIESEWLHDRSADPTGAGSDVEEWVDTARKRAKGTWREEWWTRVPQPGKGRASKDWIMFGDHYWIAR